MFVPFHYTCIPSHSITLHSAFHYVLPNDPAQVEAARASIVALHVRVLAAETAAEAPADDAGAPRVPRLVAVTPLGGEGAHS